jgi:amino acid adenylation domain-containing protein
VAVDGSEYVGARTPVEEVLAGVWSVVLGVERVGVNENFFELGGHSLLATQLVSRIREAFKVEVPLRTVFESPTVAELAAEVETTIRAEQGLSAPPIRRATSGENWSLSFAQERLWFIDQLEPDSPFYNCPGALHLAGELNVEALERCINEIVRRHETLRTTFRMVDGRPVQVVSAPRPFALPVTDLSELDESEREEEVRWLASEEARRPFDLSRGPLLRVSLLKLAGEEYVALFTTHHIISDGWSMGVLVKEVAALYAAYIAGVEPELPELPIQYADFAVWQREWLQGEVLERQLSYWRGQLAGAPPVLELPTDRPRPAVQTYNGANQSVELPIELVEKLRELSNREGATLYMTLLAAFKVLLSRYTGQKDVVVGTPIANRNRAETEGLIGFFVNTLVLRTDASGGPTFAEMLRRVREVCLGAYQHQDLPFEKLVAELQPERSLSHSPLFQVVFGLQNKRGEVLELPGITLSDLGVESGAAKFDLIHTVVEGEGGMVANLHYNTDLFDAETVERMLLHFRSLLEGVVADPSQKIQELPLLSAQERERMLVEWNDTAREFDAAACLHELFEARAALTPEATAVSYEGGEFSYRELNERANRLARRLRSIGVGAETHVGLCVERSPEMLVGILGVLKAGGACVPLDPAYPLMRLSFMLEDASVAVLLTQEHLEALLPEHSAHVIRLDADWPSIEAEEGSNTSGEASALNAAYVVYTSGSTGRPKGAMLTHRGLVNRILAGQAAYNLDADDRVLHKASFSFDASLWEIFWPLSVGARLVLARPGGQQDAAYLARVMEREGVTIAHFVPSMLQVFLEEPGVEGRCARLRRVFCGGEVLPVELAGRFFEKLPAHLHNQYGPTETSVNATYWTCVRGEEPHTIPIGRPFGNVRLYVLDELMGETPVGVAGELYIGGAGVARGYVGRPGLTAERFVPDPFATEGGARLYRTGDRVRYLPDGAVEFLGRIDHQVKVRGFRIELGEIEAAIQSHEGVRECVAAVREDAPGAKRLVAYLIPSRDEESPTPAELRTHLKERLPEYMMPSHFVLMDEMPLTPNGKVDRRALPEPSAVVGNAREYVSTRTPVEEVLAGVWSQVLGAERVGVNDNFFELGGHSLLATQLVSRIREAFKVEMPLRAVFESPTVAELAGHVEALLRSGNAVEVPPVVPAPRNGELPLSFSQERLWFIDQLEPGNPVYNIGAAVRLTGCLDMDALRRTFDESMRRHESLRTTFATVGGRPVQVVSAPGHFEIGLTDLSGLPEAGRDDETLRLAREEARKPFDLGRGPLLRVSLLRLAEEEHVALFTMHHIISDGWSMGILIREVAALYAAYIAGVEPELPEPPVQYADYAVWQRGWLRGEALESHLAYWRGQLAGAPPVLELPTDRPRPAVQSFRGAQLGFELPDEEMRQLNDLSRLKGVTLYMTLLAAFKVLLHHYAKQPDIIVGASIAGRNRAETEGLIGFFVNMLIARTDLSGDPTFRELLGRVQEMALGAYTHQDVPFEKLVEELRPERDLGYNPLFQVAFVLQNAPMSTLELAGLTISPVEKEKEVSIFDLLLEMTETPEGLRGLFTYSKDLWDAPTIDHMASLYRALLRGVVADPDARLSALGEMLAAADKRQSDDRQADYKQVRRLRLKGINLKSFEVSQT